MNFRKLFALAFCAPVLLVAACSADTSDENSDADPTDETSEDALTAREELQGAWKNSTNGVDLRPSGQFFWDVQRLTQPAGNPPGMVRKEGSWHANKRNKTLTIKVDGQETVYRYIKTAGPVLNGFPGPGGFPDHSKLTLQQLRPMTTVAVIIELDKAASWCTGSVDCLNEKLDGTWNPGTASGVPSCSHNKCENRSAVNEQIEANCSGGGYSAQIKLTTPIILNGFAMGSYSAVVKQGAEEIATLENCTGKLNDWTLRCTPRNGPLGVSKIFELNDSANKKASYKTGVVSPTAPVQEHVMTCTLAN